MIDSRQGKVLTFYSFKGGVGRSMMLANVAWTLAHTGKRVLMVDWDLEAPGLHHYFSPFLPVVMDQQHGLLDLLIRYQEKVTADAEHPDDSKWYEKLASSIDDYSVSIDTWDFPRSGSLSLMLAGRWSTAYATRVQSFDWGWFYTEQGGGGFIDLVKQNMRERYDYVLIDSRTGYSDTSGICTVQMPDEVVIVFSPNRQCVEGTLHVAKTIVRKHKEQGRNQVPVWPVLTRIDKNESELMGAALLHAREAFEDILRDTLKARASQAVDVRDYFYNVSVPYMPVYAFVDALATFFEPELQRDMVRPSVRSLTAYLLSTSRNEDVVDMSQPSPEKREAVKAAYLGEQTTVYDLAPVQEDHVRRPEVLDFLTKLLEVPSDPNIAEGGSPKVGIVGLEGTGKTELAKEVAHTLAKGHKYKSIVWLSIEEGSSPLKLQWQLGKKLGERLPGLGAIEDGLEYFRRKQQGKSCLLVLDGIESSDQIRALDFLDQNGRILFTSNREMADVVPAGRLYSVKPWDDNESEKFLMACAGMSEPQTGYREFITKLVQASGGKPRWLQFWGRLLKERRVSWDGLVERLNKAQGIDLFCQTSAEILGQLSPAEEAVCRHFVVFPVETLIPLGALETLAFGVAGLDSHAVATLIDNLVAVSLLRHKRGPAQGGRVFHVDPTFHRCLLEQTDQTDRRQAHRTLLDSYRKLAKSEDWCHVPDDGYFLDHLIFHLREADKWAEAQALLCNLAWLRKRLEIGMIEVLEDFERIPPSNEMQQDPGYDGVVNLRRALRLSSKVLLEHPAQFASQLLGRLARNEEQSELSRLLTDIANDDSNAWLRPLTPSMAPAEGPLIFRLSGHTAEVTSVAINKEGRIGVSASGDKSLRVWDLNIGRTRSELRGHEQGVRGAAISPDGRLIASASSDKTVRLWDTNGTELKRLSGHEAGVSSVAFTADGSYVVSGSEDQKLIVWDAATGTMSKGPWRGHVGTIRAITVSTGSNLIVSSGADGRVIAWSLEDGSPRHVWDIDREVSPPPRDGAARDIVGVAVNPSGSRAIFASKSGIVRIWELGGTWHVLKELSHVELADLAWSADERFIAIACSDRAVCIVNQNSAKVTELREHTGNVNTVAVATTAFGFRLLSGGGGGRVCVWHRFDDPKLLDRLAPHRRAVEKIVVDPTGRLACSNSGADDAVYWNVEDGTRTTEVFPVADSTTPIVSFQDKLFLAKEDGALLVKSGRQRDVVARFYSDSPITSYTFSRIDKVSPIIAGDNSGRVHFLELRGVKNVGEE